MLRILVETTEIIQTKMMTMSFASVAPQHCT